MIPETGRNGDTHTAWGLRAQAQHLSLLRWSRKGFQRFHQTVRRTCPVSLMEFDAIPGFSLKHSADFITRLEFPWVQNSTPVGITAYWLARREVLRQS